MTQAAQDMAAIAAWVKASSPGKFRAPMDGDWVFPAPFAALLPIDPDAPAGPQVDLSELAEGGLVFLVPTGQLATPFAADRLERTTDGLPSPAERVAHLFGHRLGVRPARRADRGPVVARTERHGRSDRGRARRP